jgi:tetratricopeptide (TPR) repeat protein
VDLQQAYGVRRELGIDPQIYDRQLQQAQTLMRLGKRTATYWISLIQYDDGRYDTAETWFSKRVLNEEQLSHWEPAARYNLARSVEHLGELERAIELYKTDGDPQEHGNRIRARLLAKSAEE